MANIKSLIIGAASLLPESLRNSLLHLSFNIARPEFDRFSHVYSHAPNMKMGLFTLTKRGIRPKTVLDVGAFEGDWSKMAREMWPDAKIIMFEPNLQKSNLVSEVARSIRAELHQDLLGATDGSEVIFNVMGSGSSVMNECSPLQRTKETRTLRRLDSILPSIDGGTLIKLDTQGYELEVLRGAENIFSSIDYILLEIAIIEINEGAPLLADVVSFMKLRGFAACEILEIHRRPLDQALNQVDIIFVRENSNLLADKRHYA